jgi:phosphoglycerate kinase
MKTIKDVPLEGKKVFLRADYNVPISNGEIAEDERIKESIKTIHHIFSNKPQLLLIVSHFSDQSQSMVPVADKLQELLGVEVTLISDIQELANRTIFPSGKQEPEVLLMENIRFWPEEEAGDEEFAKNFIQDFDVYINDAFSVSHRDHASISKMPKHVKEKCMGLLFEEEFSQLTKIKDNPDHPALAIIGGAKISTKLPVINNLVKNYDRVLVGGMIANEALDQGLVFDEKVMLPVDFGPEGLEESRLDIGPKTIELYKQEIAKAKTVMWNGPMGKFEEFDCDKGTRSMMQAIAANTQAYRVVGGGETIEAMQRFGTFRDFNYVSMSGGAMLEFMAGNRLPGIEALEQ